MSFLPIFNNKKSTNKFLVAEIDNNQLKMLALYKESEDKLRIIGSSIKKIPENIIVNHQILDKESFESVFKEAAIEATGDLEDSIKDVIIGVKGNQCIEITTTGKSTSQTKRIINEKEAESLYNKVVESAYLQAQNEVVKDSGNYEADLELVISSNVYSKIDQNLYENPIGVEGEIYESAVFNAFCFSDYLEGLKRIITKTGFNVLSIAPIPYAMVQNISKMDIPETTDYTLMNFGEDTTEIIVVFGKGLIDTQTLPIGYTHLREGISYKMGLTTEEADKILEKYSRGQLHEEDIVILQKCLKDVLNVWAEGIKLCFEEFSNIKTFAHQIYLTGEGSTVPDVINILKTSPWYKDIPFKTLPEYKKLDINDFTLIDDATGKITSSIWIPLQSLGIVYLEMQK